MHFRRRAAASLLSIVLAIPALAYAHEAAKGRNGGLRVDAGKFHTEILLNGTADVVVFISDGDDKPIDAAGFKATAILVVDGKSVRLPLTPQEGSKLTGTAPTPVKLGTKGVVQLTAPDGTSAQGKF